MPPDHHLSNYHAANSPRFEDRKGLKTLDVMDAARASAILSVAAAHEDPPDDADVHESTEARSTSRLNWQERSIPQIYERRYLYGEKTNG